MDRLAGEADDAGAACDASPRWVDTPFGGQYISDYRIGGVPIQISTVELSDPDPGYVAECAGDAPWLHFDTIDIDAYAIPVVASELRLLSDVIRGRTDRWRETASFLATHGYDDRLLSDALARLPAALQAEVRETLTPNRVRDSPNLQTGE